MELFVEEKGGDRYTEEGEGEKRERRRRSVTVLQRVAASVCRPRCPGYRVLPVVGFISETEFAYL